MVESERRSRRPELSCTGRGCFTWENPVAECLEAAVLEAGDWPQCAPLTWAERHPDCLGPDL